MNPMHPIRFPSLLLAVALVSGCATHQLRLQPLRGLPADEAARLKQGQLAVGRDRLFDAAATTLEHEPFLHWDIDLLDRANGFIKASAGLFREVQIRVTGDGGPNSQLAVSVPRRELKTRAKIWIKPDGTATAYEPSAELKAQSRVVSADVELDDLYFYSFVWHALHDRAEVPFDLLSYDAEAPIAAAAPLALQPMVPAQAPSPTSEAMALSPAAQAAAVSPAAQALPLTPTPGMER
jgi:hypothetical protein